MKRVAVVLSGCGFLDGSEIYESVLTLLALDQAGASYQCFAPNIAQARVVDYTTGNEVDETRNVLVESARLARGEIEDIAKANADDFDAIIFPGGFGAALNLSDFASQGTDCSVNADVEKFAKQFVAANKPLGFICIAPTMIPLICGKGVTCTIGNDEATASAIEAMGGKHQACSADDVVIDAAHNVVSTPAYMTGQSISEVAEGIRKLVVAVLGML